MEFFKGDLAHYRLSLLAPALATSSGLLTLERGAIRRRFVISAGAVISESSNAPGEHLSQVLADLGILDAARSAQAFAQAEAEQLPLGAFLLERGWVNAGRLEEALAHKARESFFDCYGWESGELTFSPNTPLRMTGVPLSLPIAALHREALTRMEEWRVFVELFPDDEARFNLGPGASEVQAEADKAFLARVEKTPVLRELLAIGAAGATERSLHSARRLIRLYRCGALVLEGASKKLLTSGVDVSDLISLARTHLRLGNYERSAELACRALEGAPVPEAQALYRDAEKRWAATLAEVAKAFDGSIEFRPLPHPLPSGVNSDDLYLYSKLRSSRSLRETLPSLAMGEAAAYRSLRRLWEEGLVHVPVEEALSARFLGSRVPEAPSIADGDDHTPSADGNG